ncbi:MAG: hypothetical protein KQ78_01241 [Candidatus Izimaplasma bacterium HR2]|nr:MAG: hypothetical protein KQ78_01241 [Candidatus Izimaplasma bacterium HR2]
MKKYAIANLVAIIIFNLIYMVYIIIDDATSVNLDILNVVGNAVFILGFICGVFSIVFLVYGVRDKKMKPRIPITSIALALMLIPEMFLVSLMYFFGMNR